MEWLRAEQDRVDQEGGAQKRWSVVRQQIWFNEGPVAALKQAAGPGQCCMYCDAGEANAIEHFRPKLARPPKQAYPEVTFVWENYLWSCGVCNSKKGERFLSPEDVTPLNPFDDRIWEHLVLNASGQYSGVYRVNSDEFDGRGEWTLAWVHLNREALQVRRRARIAELVDWAADTIQKIQSGHSLVEDARSELLKRLNSPLQPDVAQFYFRGPGRYATPSDPEGWPFPRLWELLSD